MRAARVFAAFVVGTLCAAGVAGSQPYPIKPVRVIVPFPPAGGILAPAGTPKPIIDQLNSELGNALRDPSVASKLANVTYDPVHRTPEELAQRLKTDYELIGKLFRQFGVRLD